MYTIPIDVKTAAKKLRPLMSGKLYRARPKSPKSATRNESYNDPKLLTFCCQFYYTAEISKIKLIITNVLFNWLVYGLWDQQPARMRLGAIAIQTIRSEYQGPPAITLAGRYY